MKQLVDYIADLIEVDFSKNGRARMCVDWFGDEWRNRMVAMFKSLLRGVWCLLAHMRDTTPGEPDKWTFETAHLPR